jgi:hypothetical protein
MKRRSFLRTLGTALAGAMLGCSPKPRSLEELTQANRELREFPTQLPGTKSIQKYEVPDAKYCLVHVKQAHKTPYDTEKDKEYITLVQNNIYQLFSYLVDKNLVSKVYNEGEVFSSLASERYTTQNADIQALESEVDKLKDREGYKQKMSEFGFGEEFTEKIVNDAIAKLPEKEKELVKAKRDFEMLKRKDRTQRMYDGAVEILASEGKLKILPADTLEGNLDASYILKQNGYNLSDSEVKKKVIEDRENIFLANADFGENSFGWLVYGAAHNFRNNIEQWNKAHPDRKYSLIEITPEGIQ